MRNCLFSLVMFGVVIMGLLGFTKLAFPNHNPVLIADEPASIAWFEVQDATGYDLHLQCVGGSFRLPIPLFSTEGSVLKARFPATGTCVHRVSAEGVGWIGEVSKPLDLSGTVVGVVPGRPPDRCDLNGDGKVTATDALGILDFAVGNNSACE